MPYNYKKKQAMEKQLNVQTPNTSISTVISVSCNGPGAAAGMKQTIRVVRQLVYQWCNCVDATHPLISASVASTCRNPKVM